MSGKKSNDMYMPGEGNPAMGRTDAVRRPVLYIGAAFAAAILIRHYYGSRLSLALLAALAILCRLRYRKGCGGGRPVWLIVTISFAAGLFCLMMSDHGFSRDPAVPCHNGDAVVTGLVIDTGQRQDSSGRSLLQMEVRVIEIRRSGGTEKGPWEKRAVTGKRQSRILVTAPADPKSEGDSAEAFFGACRVPPGSTIRFAGTMREPETKRNPNCFDYRLYLKSKRIQTVVRAETVEVLSLRPVSAQEAQALADRTEESIPPQAAVPTLGGRLFLMRENYLARLESHAGPGTAGFVRAILFGEKSQLDEDVQELFQKNGTAHILAVSGLHIGILYGAMNMMWGLLGRLFPSLTGRRGGRRFFFFSAAFFLCYTFLSGYAPSVVRAVLMVLLHAFAKMTGRRYDLNCAAFAVGVAALANNPYIIFQAGFQMSFLAILMLGLITPFIHRFYSGSLVGSMAIQIGLGPYMIYQFNVLPLLAVFINIPVIFIAGILIPMAMGGMMLPLGTEIWDRGLACLCHVLIRINELCLIDRVTSVTVASPPCAVIWFYYLALFMICSEEGRLAVIRGGRRKAAGIAVFALLAAASAGQAADDGFRKMEMVFVDVGQGDCMHLRVGSENYLIDGGGDEDYELGMKTLKPYLLKNGVRCVDGAFVTHLHTDHYKGICELAKAGMIRRIYIYEANRLKIDRVCSETGLPEERIVFLRQGHRAEMGGSLSLQKRTGAPHDRIEVLWPRKKSTREYQEMIAREEDENASSLILRVTVDGVSLLATGDLGEEGEEQLLLEYCGGGQGDEPLRADILKVGHHGSKTSSCDAFLDAVRPGIAVIQVGKNNMYGHPTPEAIERLSGRGIPIYRNDLEGAIGIDIRNGAVRVVRTMLYGHKSID